MAAAGTLDAPCPDCGRMLQCEVGLTPADEQPDPTVASYHLEVTYIERHLCERS